MSTRPRFLEKVLIGIGEGAITVSGIIAATYLGSRSGLWSDDHAWIFAQGMLLLWSVWVVLVVVGVGLERVFRPRSSPSVRQAALRPRPSFPSHMPIREKQPVSKAKHGHREW